MGWADRVGTCRHILQRILVLGIGFVYPRLLLASDAGTVVNILLNVPPSPASPDRILVAVTSSPAVLDNELKLETGEVVKVRLLTLKCFAGALVIVECLPIASFVLFLT